jgi:hypothetical protein
MTIALTVLAEAGCDSMSWPAAIVIIVAIAAPVILIVGCIRAVTK